MLSSAASASQPQRLKFVPFASAIESSFWVQYNRLKLETIKLSEAPLNIQATYGIQQQQPQQADNNAAVAVAPRMQCQESSLLPATSEGEGTTTTMDNSSLNERVHCHGVLLGYNTVEAFQTTDKNKLLKDIFWPLFEKRGDDSLQALTMFVLLTFADLKAHKVVYWFGFPALAGPPITTSTPPQMLREAWKAEQQWEFALAVQTLRRQHLSNGFPPFFVWSASQKTCQSLAEWVSATTIAAEKDNADWTFCFLDPSSTSDPGWPLRNLVAYLSFHVERLAGQTVTVLSYRPGRLRRITEETTKEEQASALLKQDLAHDQSVLLQVRVPQKHEYNPDSVKVTGWEVNARGKPGPRSVNLAPLLDHTHLAIQAADLNLKLMKWRMLPSLQVEKLQRETKALLLGAGTLGCNVARTLLGWGVRNFVLVDNGTVSYSNPVRQPLFTLEDCRNSQRPKAVAAAEALKLIAADVQAEAVHLSIPMPGHAGDAQNKELLQQTVNQLDQLIQDCSVVFLLTDTRESRWLPTVMAAAHDRLLLNAALGLDSWLVMRHGATAGAADTDASPSSRLGCYYCNDIVAPENSTKQRTLDQQCTVTRPGLAPIASSLAVELLVALLHHPQHRAAPAPTTRSNFSAAVATDDAATTPLGIVPHQVRGSLTNYTVMTPTVPAFGHCTGCSQAVIEAYRKDKHELVYQACQATGATYLEDLSGLTEFRAQAAAKLEAMDEDDTLWEEDEEE